MVKIRTTMDHSSKPQDLQNSCCDSSSGPKNSASCSPVDDDVPDGGLRAWSVVLGSFLGLFASFGIVNSYVIIFLSVQLTALKRAIPLGSLSGIL
jgi:hypothetical protein